MPFKITKYNAKITGSTSFIFLEHLNAFTIFGKTGSVPPSIGLPVNTLAPVVTGTANVGQTLSSTSGTWTNSPTYTYQWKRNGANISAATQATYTLVSADGGTSITCVVTATNITGTAVATSNVISIIAAPINSVAPVISGTNTVGSVLSATSGTWSGSPTYTYQWKRDGSNVSGASNSSYTLINADASTAITCTVTGTNASGSASANSNSISIQSSASITFLPTVTTAPSFVGGTRKGVSAYTGPLVRIQKSSSDVTQTDIGYGSDGLLDTAAILSFLGTSNIDGALVTTLYNQTGGENAVQATAANMPLLATDPEGQAVLTWGSPRNLGLSTLALNYATSSIFHLGRFASGAIFQYGTGASILGLSAFAGKLGFGTTTTRASPFVPYENTSVIGAVTGTSSIAWSIDDTVGASSTGITSTATTGGMIGNSSAANTSMNGDTQLLSIYPASLNTTDATAVRTACKTMRSITAKDRSLVFSEDSYSAGTGSTFNRNRSYYALTNASIRSTTKVFNRGKGGRQLSVANTDFPSEGPQIYNASGAKNLWLILGGSNDTANGADAATVQSRFQTYAQTVSATGFDVISYGIPVGSAGAANRPAVNAWLAANYATFSSAYTDLDGANYNTRVDGVHPDSIGYAAWSAYELPAILGRLGL